jgi:hypothetical protein
MGSNPIVDKKASCISSNGGHPFRHCKSVARASRARARGERRFARASRSTTSPTALGFTSDSSPGSRRVRRLRVHRRHRRKLSRHARADRGLARLARRSCDPPSLADAQRGNGRARSGAPRSVAGARGAHERHQHLVVGTGNRVRARDDAERRRRAGIALWTGWSHGTGRARGALRPSVAALAGRPGRPLPTGLALRALRSDGSLQPGRTGFATFSGSALGANRALRSLGALRSGWTDGTGRTSLAGRTRCTLRPGFGFAAARERDRRNKGGEDQDSLHWAPQRQTAPSCRNRSRRAIQRVSRRLPTLPRHRASRIGATIRTSTVNRPIDCGESAQH